MTIEEEIRQISEYIYGCDDNAISVETGEHAISALSAIENIKAEIQKEENILYHDCEPDFSKHFDVIRVDTVIEIIDKHTKGKTNEADN